MKKTIGILGGMGPEATVYMYKLIINNTRAFKDQEHIPVIIYSNPKIPPRTDAVLKKGRDPVPFLVEGVKVLKNAGADFFLMPCVTAHCFYPKMASLVQFPFLNLVEESLKWTLQAIPGLKKAGLIASSGTIQSGLFHDAFATAGIEVISPVDEEQEKVMDAIFGSKGIKASHTSGPPKNTIIQAANRLIQRGAEAIIAGCTEVPLVLKDEDIEVPLIEPMKITARAAIVKAGFQIKE